MRRLVPVVLQKIVGGRTWLVRPLFTKDAEFVFPGRHSFAADYPSSPQSPSRPAIKAWLERFAALQPNYTVLDIVVGGSPWNTRVAIRFRDEIGADYTNEGMHYMRMRWGRVVHERVFLDTQAVEAWEARHPEVRAGGLGVSGETQRNRWG